MFLVALLSSLLTGCTPYSGACSAEAATYCDVCPTDGFADTYCKCVQEGKLTASDFGGDTGGGDGLSDDDAQMQCDAWRNALKYPSPDEAAYCKQSLALLKEWDKDVCDSL